MNKEEKKLNSWKKQIKLIPIMIGIYCHGKHKTKKGLLCAECQKLNDYALLRLQKCPFKINKQFCSGCKIHCYNSKMRQMIKNVMRYSGPRMLYTHPVLAINHCIQTIKSKHKK